MTKDTQQLQGATGLQEVFVDRPAAVSAVAVVLHPHPLLGGNANHKVPFSIMRALTGAGVCVYRPNFRGVGESAGVFDAGELETRDILCLINHVRAVEGPLPLLLVGFSFGAYVAAKTAVALKAPRPRWRIWPNMTAFSTKCPALGEICPGRFTGKVS